MGKVVHVAPGRERHVIRRFVMNVWHKQGFRQLAQEYSSHLPSIAEAQKLGFSESYKRMMTPDAQRVSKRLLQRLLCLVNWRWGARPRISGSVDVMHWLAILRHASHPSKAVDQAVRKSSLAVVQYIEGVLQGLLAGLPISHAIQCRKRLCSFITDAFREMKRHISNVSSEVLAHGLSCLQNLQATRLDREHFSTEQNHLIDGNIAHFEGVVQRLQNPVKLAKASGVRVVENAWSPVSDVDKHCGSYRQEKPAASPSLVSTLWARLLTSLFVQPTEQGENGARVAPLPATCGVRPDPRPGMKRSRTHAQSRHFPRPCQ